MGNSKSPKNPGESNPIFPDGSNINIDDSSQNELTFKLVKIPPALSSAIQEGIPVHIKDTSIDIEIITDHGLIGCAPAGMMQPIRDSGLTRGFINHVNDNKDVIKESLTD